MAPVLSKPGESYLEKLPAEIIEKILLEVVSEVKPTTWGRWSRTGCVGGSPLASNISLAQGLLTHQLISRTLRDHSWRPLAIVISETIFGFFSRESMMGLLAISRCKELKPWLTKLTVTATCVEDYYRTNHFPHTHNIGDVERPYTAMGKQLHDDLRNTLREDEAWIPCPTPDELRHTELGNLWISFLRALPKVDHFHYYYERGFPGRVAHISRVCDTIPDYCFNWSSRAHPATDVSQKLYLGSMVEARIRPKTLELATQSTGTHFFLVPITIDVFKQVWESVEVLTLTDAFGTIGGQRYPEESIPTLAQIPITQEIFPALHILHLNLWHWYFWFVPPAPSLPSPSNMPNLTNLIISSEEPDDNHLIWFIIFYGNSLRHLTFKEMLSGSYGEVFPVLRKVSLDRLEIEEPSNPSDCETVELGNGPDPPGNRLANIVVVTPQ